MTEHEAFILGRAIAGPVPVRTELRARVAGKEWGTGSGWVAE